MPRLSGTIAALLVSIVRVNWRELIPIGRLGERIRKPLVAGALFACVSVAWHLVRDRAWDGWWDAYTWPQLFLGAPYVFLFVVMVWQFIWMVSEELFGLARREFRKRGQEKLPNLERTLRFWLHQSSRICLLYLSICSIGDIPMVLNYLANVRGWPLHWWGSSAGSYCLLLMLLLSWLAGRIPALSTGASNSG